MSKQRQKSLIRITSILIILGMLYSIGNEIVAIFSTSSKITTAKIENSNLKLEQKKLNNEIEKLHDDKYLQSYVSGTIFSTEKGTTVYILPKGKK